MSHLLLLTTFLALTDPATPLEVPLAELRSGLSVRVLSADDEPLISARIAFAPSADPSVGTTDEDGTAVFTVTPGTYQMDVSLPGFTAVRKTVTITRGRDQAVDVRLALDGVYQQLSVVEQREDQTVFKFPTTLHETPRALTLVGEEQIRVHNARSVNDTFAYAPGFAVNSNRTGGYHFYARGYRMGPNDTKIDGFAGVNAGGRYSASLFGIEQVALLRGPAGLLYGAAASPGGMVNMVTKKPKDVAHTTRLDLRSATYSGNGVGFGERNTAGLELDSTGRLDADGRVLYRAVGLMEEAAYFTDGIDDENRGLNLSLTFSLDQEKRFRLTPMFQYTRFDRPYGGGRVFSPGTSQTTNDGSEGPIVTDDLSPLLVNVSSGGGLDETSQLGFQFQGDLTSRLTLNASVRAIHYDTDIDRYTPTVSTAAQLELLQQGRVLRTRSVSQTERRYNNADLNMDYELEGGASWRSRFQVGVNTQLYTSRSTSPDGPLPGAGSPIDIYTGEVVAPLDDTYPTLSWNDWSDTSSWNGYLQNQTSFADERWVATLGLGYGQNHPEGRLTQDSDLMPNAALVFNPNQQLAIYASYATSYNPVDPEAQNAAGVAGAFAPEEGTNLEIGIKRAHASGRAQIEFSIFANELNNDLVQSASDDLNPNGVQYYQQVGTREAQGAEITVNAVLFDIQLTGVATYLDATYTGEGPEGSRNLPLPGTRAEKAPEWAGSLWATHQVSRGMLRGLGVNLGWIYSDARLGSNRGRTYTEPDPLVLPAYRRWDLGFSYNLPQGLDLRLQVQNLFDELIFVSGRTGSDLEVAPPRTVSLNAGYRF